MKKTSGRPTDEIERIVNTYGDMLYRICILMLQNESDVEDVVQETFIKYYQKEKRRIIVFSSLFRIFLSIFCFIFSRINHEMIQCSFNLPL